MTTHHSPISASCLHSPANFYARTTPCTTFPSLGSFHDTHPSLLPKSLISAQPFQPSTDPSK
ncbi:hypothetical protein BS50DRAFT_574336 [Corynespora cassiicola Philippines]|uniref:Uncharacterized protein n=1 Tax=Corynespora cassiicola Philippines TaxID=1448308 RepID=A0A2T2NK53_CORCC|nr:hypothetical protein BS50DRAFT_574336 [Corynespora cassiicola Philippines]